MSLRPEIRGAVPIAGDDILASLFIKQIPGVAEDRQEIAEDRDDSLSLSGVMLWPLSASYAPLASPTSIERIITFPFSCPKHSYPLVNHDDAAVVHRIDR